MDDKNFQIDAERVKKICGKKSLSKSDEDFIDSSIESIIKKHGDVYSIERPQRKPHKMGKHRRK